MTSSAGRHALVLVLVSLLVPGICEAFWCDAGDSEALLEFKAGFLDPGGYFTTWTYGTSCCTWEGVTCSDAARVSSLIIEPTYPPKGVYPVRKDGSPDGFGEALGRLDALERLVLCNVIFDAPAPSSIGSLARLTFLKLEANRFTGPIPATYGGLSAITSLRLNSELTGSIPRELCRLVNLESLDLSNNRLVGNIPACLVHCRNLTELVMTGNGLSGPIPTIMGSFGKLKILNLRDNRLSGRMPDELCHLWNLNSLNLADNELAGSLSPKLSMLKNLFSLDLAQNRLTGMIPKEFGSLPNLMFLSLYNNRLSGPIPVELAQLPQITSIHLSQNKLSGSLPTEFGAVPAFLRLHIDVSGNRLSGHIPDNLSNLGSLRASDNYFRGRFPLCLTAVETVVLTNNQLTSLSHYDALPAGLDLALTTLRLDNNRLHGRIPSWLNPALTKLQALDLSGNKLTGELPFALLTLPSLSKLNCSNNKLASHLPNRKLVSNVDTLDLHNNEISGAITQAFLSALPRLTYLDLSFNKLKGKIPVGANKPPMQFLGLDGNSFTGALPRAEVTLSEPIRKKKRHQYY
ncbi:hypothetical protein MPTK1_5g13350 [Marchantia polymorpha subsp. ruderalis]|nr:hypothetical protein MARPO_0032s0028 [Marchantia polymorpha]BBN11609.1 hypothetical protein Mp_5g13350 [Marchantia polymorpha subsp. ruderalis]|eukprot:PTQ41823.1 hypothetical protein MARPO_0032s0028 [Marchantia polymorpha]